MTKRGCSVNENAYRVQMDIRRKLADIHEESPINPITDLAGGVFLRG